LEATEVTHYRILPTLSVELTVFPGERDYHQEEEEALTDLCHEAEVLKKNQSELAQHKLMIMENFPLN